MFKYQFSIIREKLCSKTVLQRFYLPLGCFHIQGKVDTNNLVPKLTALRTGIISELMEKLTVFGCEYSTWFSKIYVELTGKYQSESSQKPVKYCA